jgi:ribosome-associated protein
LEEKKGENIVLLDIHEVASFTDYFILCSGTSDRMVDSLADAVREKAHQAASLSSKIEGLPGDGWTVVDLGDIVVHILSPDQRAYYKIEQLWENGKILLSLQ